MSKVADQDKFDQENSTLLLPKASVKRIMKISDEVKNIAPDALVATAKVTEEFLSMLARDSRVVCEANNRKTIRVDDMLVVIEKNSEQFGFLENMLIVSDDIKGNDDDTKTNNESTNS